MSLYGRERVAAVLACGVIAGVPLLAAAPAVAAPPEIEFSRAGVELLTCNSRPSDADVTVDAESTARFVNKLGGTATLRIDGRDASQVASGAASEVLFHRGTVRVEMVPACGISLSRDIQAVSVTVLTPSGTPSDPSPEPSSPGSGSSGGQTGRGDTSDQTNPGGTNDKRPAKGSASASPSGTPTAPADGGASPSDASTVGEGSAASGGGQGLAAEPLSSVQAPGEGGPNGLLAIIAALCVVGVSAGAIRAIIAQRATRTSVA